MAISLNRLKAEIRKMDPDVKESDDAFKAALVMVSGLATDTTIPAITKFSGLPRQFVSRIVWNLRANRIFTRDKKIAHSGWFTKDEGGVAFWMDVNCALGLMRRSK